MYAAAPTFERLYDWSTRSTTTKVGRCPSDRSISSGLSRLETRGRPPCFRRNTRASVRLTIPQHVLSLAHLLWKNRGVASCLFAIASMNRSRWLSPWAATASASSTLAFIYSRHVGLDRSAGDTRLGMKTATAEAERDFSWRGGSVCVCVCVRIGTNNTPLDCVFTTDKSAQSLSLS